MLKHPDAVRAYLEKHNAEIVSFRRAIVKIHRGPYYLEKAVIRFHPDGSVTAPKEYTPTELEAEAIKTAMSRIEFPITTLATEANLETLIPRLKNNPYFIFYDRATGNISMVQERRKNKNGSRAYIPHCFIASLAEWEVTEPDGGLPFFKPKEGDKGVRIMIHEGAKAAAAATALVNDPESKHPWKRDLLAYEHWGLIGGALAPQRTNWKELHAINPQEAVYVCDRDYAGQSALQEVSGLFGGHIKGVKFGEAFPESFDIADPLPKHLFSKGQRYIGPSFESLKVPATFATELVPQAKGRPKAALKQFFAEEWMHSVKPKVFIHRDWPNQILDPDEFNNRVKPFSHVVDTAQLLMGCDASKAGLISYDPGKSPGIYSSGRNEQFINTHVPSSVLPEEGDATLWEKYLEKFCPEKYDRIELIRWIATLVCCPWIRMLYSLLLISEQQGIGKSILGQRIISPMIGPENVSIVDERIVVDSAFNAWMAHKRLAIIHEIYQGHSSKAYNALKDVVTESTVTVNKKFMREYEISNWVHVFACSNSARALKLEDEDRRWLVPRLSDDKRTPDEWTNFIVWLEQEGGLQIIRWWLQNWLKKNDPVQPSDNAPLTTLKKDVIREAMSPGQLEIIKLLEFTKQNFNGETFFLDSDLREYVKHKLYNGHHNDRLEKAAGIRRLAKNNGWFVGEVRAQISEWGPDTYGSYVISPTPELAARTPGQIATELKLRPKKPLEIM